MYKLLKNQDLSENTIGRFKGDKDYLDAVKTLINCTEETKNRINFINSFILPSIDNENVLDIGVGNGEITHILCNHFKNIHLLDPSQNALNSINKDNFKNKVIEAFCMPVENFKKNSNFYDFVMISHTLYYINRKLWKSIIQNSFDSLKPGGCLLIVLNNGLGRSKLTHFFGDNDALKIEQLMEECTVIKNASLEIRTTH